jgi:putative Mg2+ transporter-C (MgtC) family protein
MLVAGAAALLVSLGDIIIAFFTISSSDVVRSDPIRIVEAVITGVSFLGAGTILRRREAGEVEGLTTAASLLFVAVIGICVALSELVLAFGSTALALVTLSGVKYLERWLNRWRQEED